MQPPAGTFGSLSLSARHAHATRLGLELSRRARSAGPPHLRMVASLLQAFALPSIAMLVYRQDNCVAMLADHLGRLGIPHQSYRESRICPLTMPLGTSLDQRDMIKMWTQKQNEKGRRRGDRCPQKGQAGRRAIVLCQHLLLWCSCFVIGGTTWILKSDGPAVDVLVSESLLIASVCHRMIASLINMLITIREPFLRYILPSIQEAHSQKKKKTGPGSCSRRSSLLISSELQSRFGC